VRSIRRALASVFRGDVAEHLLDVIAATGVGRTLTARAPRSAAHTPQGIPRTGHPHPAVVHPRRVVLIQALEPIAVNGSPLICEGPDKAEMSAYRAIGVLAEGSIHPVRQRHQNKRDQQQRDRGPYHTAIGRDDNDRVTVGC
jgi:hypothetical protein